MKIPGDGMGTRYMGTSYTGTTVMATLTPESVKEVAKAVVRLLKGGEATTNGMKEATRLFIELMENRSK